MSEDRAQGERQRRERLSLVLAVFSFALAVRLLYQLTARGVWFAEPLLDADAFDALGRRVASGDGFPPEPFWQPPLYPLLLGAVYWLLGPGLGGPRIAQALLGALTCAMTADLSLRLTSRRAWALGAGALVALHGPLVLYDGEILPASLATFLGALALWLALVSRPGAQRALEVGTATGLAALAAPAMLPLSLPLAWYVGRGRALWGALCLGACAAVIAPVTLSNHAYGGELIFISANGGVNLWLGNNPEGDRLVAIRPGAAWEALMREPERAGAVTAGAQDAYFARAAAAYCLHSKLSCARGLLRKARLLLSSRELPRNEDLYVMRRTAPVLGALTPHVGGLYLPHALLLPLAAAGLAAALGQRRTPGEGDDLRARHRALAAAAAALSFVPVIFFVTGRYRAPIAPSLAVLGALGLAALARKHRGAMAAGAAALVLSALPVHVASDAVDFEAEMQFEVGGRRARRGDAKGAIAALTEALSRDPGYLEAAFNLGLLLEREGRPAEAAEVYARLLERHPGDPVILRRLGAARASAGEAEHPPP